MVLVYSRVILYIGCTYTQYWCAADPHAFHVQSGRADVGVSRYLRSEMCTGVRQLNSEFVRKDFLEATGIRKESGGWKREAERDANRYISLHARLIQVFAE